MTSNQRQEQLLRRDRGLAALATRIRPPLVGWLLLLCGVSVFAVRLFHEGPYPFPRGPDVVFGLLNLLLGLLLTRSWHPSPAIRGELTEPRGRAAE